MGGGKRKHPEGAMRINFLQQARHLVLAQVGGPVGSRLAASMGHHVTAVGKKSQVRLSTEIKKTLCKVRKLSCLSQFDVVTQGCAGLLLPPLAAQAKLARLNRKEKILKLTCNICTTQKKIFIKPKQKTEKKKS